MKHSGTVLNHDATAGDARVPGVAEGGVIPQRVMPQPLDHAFPEPPWRKVKMAVGVVLLVLWLTTLIAIKATQVA